MSTQACQNSRQEGSRIKTPQCYDNDAEFIVDIQYSHVESDTLLLCEECKDRIVSDARSHGYDVRVTDKG